MVADVNEVDWNGLRAAEMMLVEWRLLACLISVEEQMSMVLYTRLYPYPCGHWLRLLLMLHCLGL